MHKDEQIIYAGGPDALALYKAACGLADRYRAERDGARAATEATKSKLVDAVGERGSVRDAIRMALGSPGATVSFDDRGVTKSRHAPGNGRGVWTPTTKAAVRKARPDTGDRFNDDGLEERLLKVRRDIQRRSGLGGA
jgi:hypothetical protein